MQPLVLKMNLSLDGFTGTADGGVAPLLELSDDESRAWVVEAISGASAHLMGRKTFSDMAAWWPSSTEAFAEPMNRIPKIVFTRSPDFDPAAPGATTGAVASMADLPGELPPRTGPDAATLDGWRHPEVCVGDLAGHVVRLKQRPPAQPGQPGGSFLLAHGGAGFARALIATGEIDEYRLVFAPIALGRGLPIFSSLTSALRLELIDQRRFANGIVAGTYRPRRS